MDLRSIIREVPDFPKEGILFRDVMTLLADPRALDHVVNEIVKEWGPHINAVAGLEARGFLFGSPLAYELRVPFVPIRKKGKLPGKVVSQTYVLEYGTDTIEIQEDAFDQGARVLVIDDLLATGGTAAAACALIEKVGARVVGCAFVIELAKLGGRDKLAGRMIQSLQIYQDEPVS
ncbi:adenine phosphoribosyltransferase [Candidatus Kaiserbacteria bacterium]|nr:adenine phosphoribosyltransferase [Candidatus Kaiserbacteria bacterium]